MLRGRAAMFDFPNHPSADSFAVNSGQRHGQQCVQRTGYGWLEWRTFVLPRRLGKGQVVRIRPRRPTPPPLLAVGRPGVPEERLRLAYRTLELSDAGGREVDFRHCSTPLHRAPLTPCKRPCKHILSTAINVEQQPGMAGKRL